MSLRAEIHKKLGAFSLDISLETQGGVLGVLGASGCGKSMTLKCIAGIEKPDSGYIALDGTVLFDSKRGINLAPQQRKVGYLFQNYALFPHMTVRQNILCGLKWEKRREIREQKYRDILKLLQLEELQKHRPHQLSGGQAQRTALARMLVNEPHLLLLDEPFSALDSHLREKLQMELRELLKRYGRDVLLVTHSRDEAYHMCGQVAVLHQGTVLTQQETRDVFANPQSVQAAVLTGCKNLSLQRKAGSMPYGCRNGVFSLRRRHRCVMACGQSVSAHMRLILPFQATDFRFRGSERWKNRLNGLHNFGLPTSNRRRRRFGGGFPNALRWKNILCN